VVWITRHPTCGSSGPGSEGCFVLVEMQVRSTDTVPDLPYLMGEAGRGVCLDRWGGGLTG